MHNKTLHIYLQAIEEENITLKEETEFLHKEISGLKAIGLRVMMEKRRLKLDVDNLKANLQLAELRVLSISSMKDRDGNCRLLKGISWVSFPVLFGYLEGFLQQSGSWINNNNWMNSETQPSLTLLKLRQNISM